MIMANGLNGLRAKGARAVALLAAISMLLAACGGESNEATGEGGEKVSEITFVTPFGFLVGFAPVLVADASGSFDEHGLDVTIQGGQGSSQAVQQVVSDQAMLSRTGGIDLMKAVANESADIVAVATIAHQSPFNVISSPDAPIDTPDDMEGKTIGVVSPNGATENILDVMLSEAGVDPKSVKREVVGNAPGAYSLVQSGKVDAYIATISTVVSLRQAGEDVVAWNTDEVAPIPGQVYIAKKSSLDENADEIVAFLASVNDTVQSISEEPDGYEKAYEHLTEFEIAGIENREESIAALEEEAKLWPSLDGELLTNDPDAWQTGADLMAKAGLIPDVDASQFYTNKYVEEALGE